MSSIINNVDRIETPRFTIRQCCLEDAEQIRTTIEQNIPHLTPWMPWINQHPMSTKKMGARIKEWNAQFLNNIDFTYGIFSKEGNKYIGSTGLHPRQGPGILEIGYWISKEYINKGIATEISYALTKVGLFIAGAKRIEIHCDEKNIRSGKIPKKLNFTLEGGRRIPVGKELNTHKTNRIYGMFPAEFNIFENLEPVQAFNKQGGNIKFNMTKSL